MKAISILVAFLSFSYFSVAQTIPVTPYQKRVYSLKSQMLKEFGAINIILNKAKTLEDLDALEKFVYTDPSIIQRVGEERLLLALVKYAKLISEASNLKNEVDRNKDNQLKLEKEKQEKSEQFNNSDYGILIKNVKVEFGKWLQKGEFEKTDDYEKRLVAASINKNFKTIILNEISLAIKFQKTQFSDYLRKFNKTLLPYNADKEFFPISFQYSRKKWIDTIHVALQKAGDFKSEFNRYYVDTKEDDWHLENNYWIPNHLQLKNDNDLLSFTVPITKETIIDLKPYELGFPQTFLKDIRFNYSDYSGRGSINLIIKYKPLDLRVNK